MQGGEVAQEEGEKGGGGGGGLGGGITRGRGDGDGEGNTQGKGDGDGHKKNLDIVEDKTSCCFDALLNSANPWPDTHLYIHPSHF